MGIDLMVMGWSGGLSLGWLPFMELPLPLVVVGGIVLAIASNRSTRSANGPARSPVQPVARSTRRSPAHSSVRSSTQSASVTLPNTGPERSPQPISPTIAPPASRGNPFDQPPSSIAATDNRADPQLPTFVAPQPAQSETVSFDIKAKKKKR